MNTGASHLTFNYERDILDPGLHAQYSPIVRL